MVAVVCCSGTAAVAIPRHCCVVWSLIKTCMASFWVVHACDLFNVVMMQRCSVEREICAI